MPCGRTHYPGRRSSRVFGKVGIANPTNPYETLTTTDLTTREAISPPTATAKVLPNTVGRIRRGADIPVTNRRNKWSHDLSWLSPPQLAARLNISMNWIYVQIRQKRLLIDQQPTGAYFFQNTPSVINAVKSLRKHAVNCIDLRICQPHQEAH